jgi:hypothetical protein
MKPQKSPLIQTPKKAGTKYTSRSVRSPKLRRSTAKTSRSPRKMKIPTKNETAKFHNRNAGKETDRIWGKKRKKPEGEEPDLGERRGDRFI